MVSSFAATASHQADLAVPDRRFFSIHSFFYGWRAFRSSSGFCRKLQMRPTTGCQITRGSLAIAAFFDRYVRLSSRWASGWGDEEAILGGDGNTCQTQTDAWSKLQAATTCIGHHTMPTQAIPRLHLCMGWSKRRTVSGYISRLRLHRRRWH